MIAEAMEKVQALVEKAEQHLTVDGRNYLTGDWREIVPPAVTPFSLRTLTGLVDVVKAAPDSFHPDEWIAHVLTPTKVIVEAKSDDEYGRRAVFASCELLAAEPYPFGRFLDREAFVIGLLSQFVESDELIGLLRLTSSMSNDAATLSEDDGVSQKVTVKSGIALKELATVRPRWVLKPYRTFREIDQPASMCLFRVKGEAGSVPSCALFEADGGTWRLDAVLAIKAWLEGKGLGLSVVA